LITPLNVRPTTLVKALSTIPGSGLNLWIMKHLSLILVLVFLAGEVFAQTNQPARRALYFVPHLQLRQESSEPAKLNAAGVLNAPQIQVEKPSANLNTAPASSTGARFERSTVGLRQGDFDYQVFHRLDQEGYFERPPAPADSAVARWAQNAFTPDVMHLGKTTVSCSLVTAIKRKNPLWLLDPYFLQVSW